MFQSNTLNMYSGPSGNILFNTNGDNSNEAMRITSTKNIGIGTTSPLAKLDVYGTAGNNNIVNFASSSNVSQFLIGPNGSTTIASLGTGLVRSSSGSLYTDTATYLTSAITSLAAKPAQLKPLPQEQPQA